MAESAKASAPKLPCSVYRNTDAAGNESGAVVLLCRGTVLRAPDVESDYNMVVLKGEVVVQFSGDRGASRRDTVHSGELVAPAQDLSGGNNCSAICTRAVSYTHLTLPTILLV